MVREWTAPQRTFLVEKKLLGAEIYHPMPHTLDELLRHAERVVDEINNQKQDMVIRAVRKMKERAQACVAVGGGVFEGRKL